MFFFFFFFQFYLQDTKSSNGTFINSQRLSRGSEESPPCEILSGDIIQFGVDVTENTRKGTGMDRFFLLFVFLSLKKILFNVIEHFMFVKIFKYSIMCSKKVKASYFPYCFSKVLNSEMFISDLYFSSRYENIGHSCASLGNGWLQWQHTQPTGA